MLVSRIVADNDCRASLSHLASELPAKLTRHTSPRRIESVADKCFAPFVGLNLTVPVGGHLRIIGRQAVVTTKGRAKSWNFPMLPFPMTACRPS